MNHTIKNMSRVLERLEDAIDWGHYRDVYTLSNIYRELFRIGENTENNMKDNECKNVLALQVVLIDELCELLRGEFEIVLESEDYKSSEVILRALRNLIYRKGELESFFALVSVGCVMCANSGESCVAQTLQ